MRPNPSGRGAMGTKYEQVPRWSGERRAMMRLRRASVIAALTVLALSAIASAECAWVMWTEERHSGGGPIKLSPSDAFDTREQCTARLAHPTALVGRGLGGRVVGNVVVMSDKEGEPSLMYTYFCLPDTVDPRGPAGAR